MSLKVAILAILLTLTGCHWPGVDTRTPHGVNGITPNQDEMYKP